jgi:hypothetical protein
LTRQKKKEKGTVIFDILSSMFQIICLRDCPHSEEAAQLFQSLFPASSYQIKWVDASTKNAHKTPKKSTFPQISFFVKNAQGHEKEIFIGGLSDFQELQEIVNQLKQKNYNAQIVIPMMKLFAGQK